MPRPPAILLALLLLPAAARADGIPEYREFDRPLRFDGDTAAASEVVGHVTPAQLRENAIIDASADPDAPLFKTIGAVSAPKAARAIAPVPLPDAAPGKKSRKDKDRNWLAESLNLPALGQDSTNIVTSALLGPDSEEEDEEIFSSDWLARELASIDGTRHEHDRQTEEAAAREREFDPALAEATLPTPTPDTAARPEEAAKTAAAPDNNAASPAYGINWGAARTAEADNNAADLPESDAMKTIASISAAAGIYYPSGESPLHASADLDAPAETATASSRDWAPSSADAPSSAAPAWKTETAAPSLPASAPSAAYSLPSATPSPALPSASVPWGSASPSASLPSATWSAPSAAPSRGWQAGWSAQTFAPPTLPSATDYAPAPSPLPAASSTPSLPTHKTYGPAWY